MGDFRMPILSRMKCLGHVTFNATDEIRNRAQQNHGQSLERLRQRGGLGWTELYCAVYNKDLGSVVHNNASNEQVRKHFIDDLHWTWDPQP